MNLIFYLALILFLIVLLPLTDAVAGANRKPGNTVIVQDQIIDSIPLVHTSKKWPLWKLGTCVIYEKDGSQIRNLVLKEIHDLWIVYEKDGSLHDKEIDQIARISIGADKRYSIFFDEFKKPYLDYH